MTDQEFINQFICPYCNCKAVYPKISAASWEDTECACKETSLMNYHDCDKLIFNLPNKLSIILFYNKNNYLSFFYLLSSNSNPQRVLLSLNQIPQNLNWNNSNDLINQLEILTTFQ